MKKSYTLLFVLTLLVSIFMQTAQAQISYVTTTGSGSNDGTSWANAYEGLQAALNARDSGQIWVAKGTYKPSYDYGLGGGSRYYHFRMKNKVAIYGGFAGNESSINQRTDYGRGGANETILSGDLNDNGKDDNDCYHVFYHPDGLRLNNSALLDGFTIKGGNANGNNLDNCGGGMLNYKSSPTISNCIFTTNSAGLGGGLYNFNDSSNIINCTFTSNSANNGGAIYFAESIGQLINCTFKFNTAYVAAGIYTSYSIQNIINCIFESNSTDHSSVNEFYYGGGMYNYQSSHNIVNCKFISNVADGSGGGIYNSYSTLTITNCILTSNSSNWHGGGMYNSESAATLINCTMTFNSASLDGGGMYNSFSSPTINNSIIWGNISSENRGNQFYIKNYSTTLNYSCYANGTNDVYIDYGTFTATNNNITIDPMFVGSGEHPYLILGVSPCVDAGNNEYITEEFDIRGTGYPRKLDKATGEAGKVDMGAYEYKVGEDPLLTDITKNEMSKPKEFELLQNYPNPFNPTTTISYAIPTSGNVSVKVYNSLGQKVATLFEGYQEAGRKVLNFDGSNLTSGIYFCKIKYSGEYKIVKMMLMK